MGTLLQAKIANDLGIFRHLKPTIFQLIGADEKQISRGASLHV